MRELLGSGVCVLLELKVQDPGGGARDRGDVVALAVEVMLEGDRW